MALVDQLISAVGDVTNEGVPVLIGLAKVAAIAVIGIILARLARRSVYRALGRARADRNVTALVTNLAAAGVYLVTITLILGVFGVDWTALLTLIGASSIVIALSLQDLLKSYVAGIYLLLERPFAVGDQIQVKDVAGEIELIDLRTTMVRNKLGERVVIPNATMFAEVVTNQSVKRNDRTTVTLSKLTGPLNEVTASIRSALAQVEGLAERPPVIDILSATTEGASVSVTLYQPARDEGGTRMLLLLREAFPGADLTVERG